MKAIFPLSVLGVSTCLCSCADGKKYLYLGRIHRGNCCHCCGSDHDCCYDSVKIDRTILETDDIYRFNKFLDKYDLNRGFFGPEERKILRNLNGYAKDIVPDYVGSQIKKKLDQLDKH